MGYSKTKYDVVFSLQCESASVGTLTKPRVFTAECVGSDHLPTKMGELQPNHRTAKVKGDQ